MTRRFDEKVWADFQAWCRRRRLGALPAHPWTVAAYTRWQEPRMRLSSILRRLDTIGARHVGAGWTSPLDLSIMVRTLRMVEARKKARAGRKPSLFSGKDFTETEVRPEPSKEPERKGRRALSSTPRLVSRRMNVSEG